MDLKKDPIQHLYDSMTEMQLEKARAHYKPSTRFRASESANCMRQIWHRLRGDRPAPRDAMGMMYGILGDIDHDITRDLLNQVGVNIGHVTYAGNGAPGVETLQEQKDYKVKLASGKEVDIVVSGRADGSLNTPKGRALLEIKGIGAFAYKWMNKAFEEGGQKGVLDYIKEKRPSWYGQMQTSMAIFGYDLCYLVVKDRSTGTLGFVNEETGERAGAYVVFDPAYFHNTLQRFGFVKSRLGAEEGPKPEFAAKSKECGFCDFRWLCHGADERRKKGLEPVYLYPGPQMMEYHDGESDGPERTDAGGKDDDSQASD